MIALIAELVARGQVATAVARELHARGWIDDEERRPAPADAIHQRFVNRRSAVGPYAPYASITAFLRISFTPADNGDVRLMMSVMRNDRR